jgi:hypothetical protein
MKINRKSFPSVFTAATVCIAGAAFAQGQSINVTVDGDIVAFGAQKPVEQFGSVLVPLRGVFEKLGATVAYDGGSHSILAVKGPTTITLKLGQSQATVNGSIHMLSVPAQAVNGTTLVPLRFVSEALGAGVQWRPDSHTVIISTNGAPPTPTNVAVSAPPAATTGLEVTSFTQNASHALKAGEILTARLEGTPGASATFSIPGIATAKSVPMQETSPGNYAGTFTVPGGITVKGASLFAQIRRNGQSSPLVQAGSPVSIDSVGPVLNNLSPAPNTALPEGRPLVYGTYTDVGSGINSGATTLLVNGKDVTANATVTDAFFSYRPDAALPLGKNTATVVVHDGAGNETRREWAFTMTPGTALLKSVTVSPAAGSYAAGDVLTVEAKGAPGGHATFNVGGTVKDRSMKEESAGVYVGTYTIQNGDSLSKAPATVTLTSGGRTVTQTAAQEVTIAAGPPAKLTITSPGTNASVGDSVVVSGRAKPGSTVRYTIRYEGTLIILPTAGNVTDGEVKADAEGVWKTPAIPISTPLGLSRVTYFADAVTVGAASTDVSEMTTVSFKH